MTISQELREMADHYAPESVLPFNKPEILTLARSKLGMRREQTEEALRKLHSLGYISNPESDTPYLPERFLPSVVPSTMRALSSNFPTNDIIFDSPSYQMAAVWKVNEAIGDQHGIIPSQAFNDTIYNSMPEDERTLFDLIVERFITVFTFKLPLISKDERATLLAAADLIDQFETDVSDENKGLWRFWNRKASELASGLAKKEPS